MRFCPLVLAGSLILAVSPAFAAEDADQKGSSDRTSALEILGDVVDGVGGILKVLVGPPISSPSPALNLPDTSSPPPVAASKPAAAQLPSLVIPAPPAPPPPVAIPAPPPVQPAAIIAPPRIPAVKPQPAAISPTPPAPVARPQPPRTHVAVAPPPPPAEPGCRTRAAATATLEQAARLPRCEP